MVILDPAILFFFLGTLAVYLRSNLEIPQPLPKLFSIYLLTAIGFKGGVELHASGITRDVVVSLSLAMLMAVIVPVVSYWILRRKLDVYNSAAIAAAYGSVSAVTFATAQSFLQGIGVPSGGHMVAAMALMESPAILVGIAFAARFAPVAPGQTRVTPPLKDLIHEAFTNASVFLLLGALVIGLITGEKGGASLKPFFGDIYKGALCFFLLDMGLIAARRLRDLVSAGPFLLAFAIGLPIVNAAAGIGLAYAGGLGPGDALLFTILCASASYIAVPAAMRLAVPEANPSLYISLSLAVTFPFNIFIGLPLYHTIIQRLWS